MTVEIKPGPELDRAVAEAAGIFVEKLTAPNGKSGYMRTDIPVNLNYPLFSPSTDLNAAFAAAEKVGLFERYDVLKYDGRWVVALSCDYWTDDDVLVKGETPALAICAAILKLKNKQ